ncbi:tandem-95 repeat protein [Chryseolinea soli]|uniref:Tandem-95 repeat protein n=1 Tax=Chryseolinea soli TaxID=2321403 RepID=A0A385SUS4_9BACT|nr:tandem-95 repeat protein [Chryseolinea soli]AYB34051.1 tandem-95 repeat protein [Chryseolinea soli]
MRFRRQILLSLLFCALTGLNYGQIVPVITGQNPDPVPVDEDQPLNIDLSNLMVDDADNTYPDDFSLTVNVGSNYSVSGTTITPDLNFNGPLPVSVEVNDGTNESAPFNLNVVVNAVNDPPSITGQTPDPVPVNEDQPLSIDLANLLVADPDNTYPADFSLIVNAGSNYSVNGTTITPVLNFSGPLPVSVEVNDGTNESAPFNLNVVVNAVNDPPTITGQTPDPVPVNEDQPLNIDLANLLVADPDNTYPADFSLIVNAGSNYAVNGTTITPVLNFSGPLPVSVEVNDGTNESAPFNLNVLVNAMNDPPDITGQNVITTAEETSVTVQISDLTISDPDNVTADFSVIISPGSDYTASGDVVTPNLNFTGMLTVNIQVSDGVNVSTSYPLKINVTPVNDTPVITGQNPVSTLENIPFTVATTDLIISDPDDSYPAGFTTSVLPGANYLAVGNLVTPALGFSGTLIVKVQVSDGSASSNVFDLNVTVGPINDPPVIIGQNAVTIAEEQTRTMVVTDVLILDLDDTYPGGFTLTVLPGTNYTFSGNVIKPVLNFNGPLTVNVKVNDGDADSNTFGVSVTVTPVNDAPSITGQNAVTTNENQARTIQFNDLLVTDVDNSYPTGFSLSVAAGTNYTVAGTTITPAAGFTGNLSVNVSVNDGAASSAIFPLQVTVLPVNDPPVISGQNLVSMAEDQSRLMQVTDVLITDPDDTYPGGFTLTVLPGTNYTFSGNTITPVLNFTGTLTVNVKVNDGDADSPSFGVSVTVTPVNDAPVITGQVAVSTVEDTPKLIALANVVVSDPDNATFTLVVEAGTNYTFSGNTITPALNFNGTLSVNVHVSDGTATSASFPLQVTVTPVNDAPVITGQVALSIPEETSYTIVLANLVVTDPDNASGFTLTAQTGANYALSGTTVTPVANFNGILTVNVQVSDGTASSAVFPLKITVTPVNDPPVITGQSPISVAEDGSITLQLSQFTFTDQDNTAGFLLNVGAGSNYTVSGTTVSPAANYNGPLTVPVTVSDGANASAVFNATITVTPVNDAPQITGQVPLTITESQSLPLTLSQLTVLDPDNTYPNDFQLFVLSGSNYSVSGNVVTPAPNFSGTLQVQVFVNDGTVNSPFFNLQISVNATNDPPVITGQQALAVNEDNPITIVLANVTVTDPDNTAADMTLTVLAGTGYTFSGNTVTPSLNFNGTLTVKIKVNDGTVDSAPFNLQVTVNPVNDPPVINSQGTLSTNEDTPLTLVVANFNISDPDNASGFVLSVGAGTNYTLSSTNQITPALNFNGVLTVPVTVSDGSLSSATFNASVTVKPVNDPPTITGQVPLFTIEDTPLILDFANLLVSDVDNTYSTGFTMIAQAGANYTVSAGPKITPAVDFNGVLTVNIQVSDGAATSAVFPLKITVTDDADAPTITGQNPVTIAEDATRIITLADLKVTDADSNYPDDFTLTVLAGTNYAAAPDNTITPAANFSGTLAVNVRVNDGTANSNIFPLQVTVTPVNDPPTFDPLNNITVVEDSPAQVFTIQNISAGPLEASQQLSLTVVSDNTALIPQPTFTYNGTATSASVAFKPVADAFGVATITVKVLDTDFAEYSTTFTITVTPINDAPTLNPIAYGPILEDADLQIIPLAGISTGGGENQTLTVTASTNKPELFETFEVVYTSPQATGSLKVKTKANANGTAQITVRVEDDGPGTPAPNVNFVTKVFNLAITPVNDLPVFTSQPIVLVEAGKPYEYLVEVTDVEGDAITLTAPTKPSWLTFTVTANGKGKLAGTPPLTASGPVDVKLQAKDGSPTLVDQAYKLVVNSRPVVKPFAVTTQEDTTYPFTIAQYAAAFSDADGNPIVEIQITQLPQRGHLTVNNTTVSQGDKISAGLLSTLKYTPQQDSTGADTLRWMASDGFLYSLAGTYVAINVTPVNDAPIITFIESDTLKYELGSEVPVAFSPQFDAYDPDKDDLTGAEIGFRQENYRLLNEMLLFTNTANIKGTFNPDAGVLSLTGKATAKEYRDAIRSVQYNYINAIDIILDSRTVYVTLSDGKSFSETKDRVITLIYTFKDLDIPTAFTPNGDQANETWIISSVNGTDQYQDAEVSVYNKRGTLLFRSQGFDTHWNGTYNGEVLPVDTYFYTIDLKYNKVRYKGTVTILR